MSKSTNEWNLDDHDEDDEEEITQDNGFEEGSDEDEFGLPTLSAARRKAKRIHNEKSYDPGGAGANSGTYAPYLQPASIANGRERSNSSDIAEERGPPNYPVSKKSEGKILRPQYKDILRGTRFPNCRDETVANVMCQTLRTPFI